jgi:hypothetical protein
LDQTSNKARTVLILIFHTMPLALSIPISSSSDWIALRATYRAFDFPEKFDIINEPTGKFQTSCGLCMKVEKLCSIASSKLNSIPCFTTTTTT